MVKSADFSAVCRSGKAASKYLVVHRLDQGGDAPALVGFVVSKRVFPNATDRNRTKRRLRHLMRERVGELDGCKLVIRALPAIRQAEHKDIERSLDIALEKSGRKAP